MPNKERWHVTVTEKASGNIIINNRIVKFVTDVNEELAAKLGTNWRDLVDISTEFDFDGLPTYKGPPVGDIPA